MKKIDEMTEQEILALTNDEITAIVEYLAAEAGLALLVEPIMEELEDEILPDSKLYVVNHVNIQFPNRNDAQKVADFLTGIKACNYDYKSGNYDYKYISSVKGNFYITEMDLYSTVELARNGATIYEDNRKKQEDYKTKLEAYRIAKEAYNSLATPIYDKRNTIKEKYHTMNRMVNNFNRYLTIANGNEEIAMKFLVNNYPSEMTDECIQYVKEQLTKGE